MVERLILVAALAAAGVIAYRLFQRWELWRTTRIAPRDPLLATLRPGVPTILYFTTPTCAPCKTQQRPAIRQLLDDLGDGVQVIEVNALENPAAADRWGVLSVPTTFVLDRTGRPHDVNHGVTGTEKLKQQVSRLAA